MGFLIPHFAVSLAILRRDRLLEKLDLMRLHEPAHANGRSGVIGVIGVDKQSDPRTNRRSDNAKAFNIVSEAKQANLDLEELEASVGIA